ncbi:MAG: PAS domain S-box protein [Pseudomonadota bacterium]
MTRRFVRLWLSPLLLLALLLALTFAIWREQQRHQHSLADRHLEDVGTQASRSLQEFLELHLRVVELFARRWSTHEDRDFSQRRFEEFAAVMLEEFQGFQTWTLLVDQTDTGGAWVVDRGGASLDVVDTPELNEASQRSRREGQVVLSAPLGGPDGVSLYAVAPLIRDGECLGALAARIRARSLLEEGLHDRLRSEFSVAVWDGERAVYGDRLGAGHAASGRSFAVNVADRHWKLLLAPRRSASGSGAALGLAVPLLGALLSLLAAALVHLLLRRAEVLRQALQAAVREVRERERAEAALRASEARYRGVFDAATDGMLVLDEDGAVVEASAAAGQILGVEPAQLIGQTLSTLLGDEGSRQTKALRGQLAQLGRARMDAIIPRADGVSVDVELRGTRLRQGDVACWLVTLTDVSARLRAMRRLGLLSRKVLSAQEQERGRLSRELHDELGQLLTALRLEMGSLRKHLPDISPAVQDQFGETAQLVEHATDELRRICRGLRPPLLDDLGLEPAVQQLLREFQQHCEVETAVELRLDERWPVPPEVALTAYRILQESLTNVRRHADARSVHVELRNASGELYLEVHDDGRGFEPASLDDRQGCGVEGMRERATLVDGTVDIRSAPFQGTRVRFTASTQSGVATASAPVEAAEAGSSPTAVHKESQS